MKSRAWKRKYHTLYLGENFIAVLNDQANDQSYLHVCLVTMGGFRDLYISYFLMICLHIEGSLWLANTAQKATIHQVTTTLVTSKNVLFPGHNHLLTTSIEDPLLAGSRAIIKGSGHQYHWLAGGYDLEIGQFLEVTSMDVTW